MAGGSRDQRNAVPSAAVGRQFVEAEGVPDLYADEFWLSSGPVGVTMTLIASVPVQPGSPVTPGGRIVGRLRMSPQLAVELAKLINGQITGQVTVVSTDQTSGGPKN
jgi:hypothetical protein